MRKIDRSSDSSLDRIFETMADNPLTGTAFGFVTTLERAAADWSSVPGGLEAVAQRATHISRMDKFALESTFSQIGITSLTTVQFHAVQHRLAKVRIELEKLRKGRSV